MATRLQHALSGASNTVRRYAAWPGRTTADGWRLRPIVVSGCSTVAVRHHGVSRLWSRRATGSFGRRTPTCLPSSLRNQVDAIRASGTPPSRYAQTRRHRPPRWSKRWATTSLVTTRLRVTRLPIAGAPAGLRWSADGRRISSYFFTALPAYRSFTTSRTALYREQLDARGRRGRENLVAQSPPGGQLAFAAIPQFGDAFVYWMGSERSAAVAADGQDLVVAAPSGTPRSLGMSLVNPDWITFAPDGRRFVFVAGGGREAWHAKTLELCDARCKRLPAPAGSISVDPTWNPRDARIAFVHAADVGPDGGYGKGFIPSWINRRALWVQSTQSGIVHPLERFGTGIFWPHWSRDGRMLLAFRDGEIWLGSPNGSAPQRIVSGLARPADFDAFMFDHGVSTGADAPADWTGG